MELKAGTRLKSAVCETQVIAVRAPAVDVTITCGGQPLLTMDDPATPSGQIEAGHDAGTLLGKRYADESGGIELLCTKAGKGSLWLNGAAMGLKEAKALLRRRTDTVMNIAMLLQMAADGMGDRRAVAHLTYAGLLDLGPSGRGLVLEVQGVGRVGFVDVNTPAFPVALFGAAVAGFAVRPYQLLGGTTISCARAVTRLGSAVVVADAPGGAAARAGFTVVSRDDFRAALRSAPAPAETAETDEPAVLLLFTSGTSGDPKIAVLRHDNLVSYILGTVEFMGAGEEEAQLVAVPPLAHIAGITRQPAQLPSTAARRIVQMAAFDPADWAGRPSTTTRGSPTPWSCRPCWPGSSTSTTSEPPRPSATSPMAVGACPCR